MSGRLAQIFAKCRTENRAALVAYLMACDPNYDQSLDYFSAAYEGGADIIEIGMPFSDPIADGPVIQAAAGRALSSDGSLERALFLSQELRADYPDRGQILMSYLNPLLASESILVKNYNKGGFENPSEQPLIDNASRWLDGLLPVDLDPEDDDRSLPKKLREASLDRITLIADSTPHERQAALLRRARGFAYYIARRGVTGAQQAIATDLPEKIKALQALNEPRIPIAVGFGLSRPEDVAAVARHADGVIVGSALVQLVGDGAPPEALRARVAELRAACARP